jgi:hypothetical protein
LCGLRRETDRNREAMSDLARGEISKERKYAGDDGDFAAEETFGGRRKVGA